MARVQARSVVAPNAVSSTRDKVAARKASGRLYKAFWYVPEVKRWVKSVEEYFDAGGTRTERYQSELEAFHAPGK